MNKALPLRWWSWAVWLGRSSPSERRSLWTHTVRPDSLTPLSYTAWNWWDKTHQDCDKRQTQFHISTESTYLKLPVRSEAPGLNNTWVTKLAPRLEVRKGETKGERNKKKSASISCLLQSGYIQDGEADTKENALLIPNHLMIFLRRSQPYTPPFPL